MNSNFIFCSFSCLRAKTFFILLANYNQPINDKIFIRSPKRKVTENYALSVTELY